MTKKQAYNKLRTSRRRYRLFGKIKSQLRRLIKDDEETLYTIEKLISLEQLSEYLSMSLIVKNVFEPESPPSLYDYLQEQSKRKHEATKAKVAAPKTLEKVPPPSV